MKPPGTVWFVRVRDLQVFLILPFDRPRCLRVVYLVDVNAAVATQLHFAYVAFCVYREMQDSHGGKLAAMACERNNPRSQDDRYIKECLGQQNGYGSKLSLILWGGVWVGRGEAGGRRGRRFTLPAWGTNRFKHAGSGPLLIFM